MLICTTPLDAAQMCRHLCNMETLYQHHFYLFYTKWRHLLKDNNSFFSHWRTTKIGCLKLLAFWLQSKHHKKSTARVSFFHLKICLMCLPFYCKVHSSRWLDVTIHWCPKQNYLHALVHIKSPTSTIFSCCSDRPWMASCLAVFQYTAAVDFMQQLI